MVINKCTMDPHVLTLSIPNDKLHPLASFTSAFRTLLEKFVALDYRKKVSTAHAILLSDCCNNVFLAD